MRQSLRLQEASNFAPTAQKAIAVSVPQGHLPEATLRQHLKSFSEGQSATSQLSKPPAERATAVVIPPRQRVMKPSGIEHIIHSQPKQAQPPPAKANMPPQS